MNSRVGQCERARKEDEVESSHVTFTNASVASDDWIDMN